MPTRKLWRLLIALPILALALVACGDPEPTPVGIEANRDGVSLIQEGQRQPLLAPAQAVVQVGTGIDVDLDGRAILRFGDLLAVEVLRGSELIVQTLPQAEQGAVAVFRQNGGTTVNDFDADATVAERVTIFSDFAEITATGTRWLIIKEEGTPLEWVIAMEATNNDLMMRSLAGAGQMMPVGAGFARWVAPMGEPSELIDYNDAAVQEWLRAVQAGQGAAMPEIGEVLWEHANILTTTDPLPGIPDQIGQVFELEGVQLWLNPASPYGDGFPTYAFRDCNGDGLSDIYIQNGALEMDFRRLPNRVRTLDVTLWNGSEAGEVSSLTVYNPGNQPLNQPLRWQAAPGTTEVLSRFSDSQPYHRATLAMRDGCFLGFSLTPPTEDESDYEPRRAIDAPLSNAPTPTTTPTLDLSAPATSTLHATSSPTSPASATPTPPVPPTATATSAPPPTPTPSPTRPPTPTPTPTLAPTVDLALNSFLAPFQLRVDTYTYAPSVVVVNQGNRVEERVRVRLLLSRDETVTEDDELLDALSLDAPFRPAESRQVAFFGGDTMELPLDTVGGAWYLLAEVQPADGSDTLPQNNVITQEFNVTALPDLVVTSFQTTTNFLGQLPSPLPVAFDGRAAGMLRPAAQSAIEVPLEIVISNQGGEAVNTPFEVVVEASAFGGRSVDTLPVYNENGQPGLTVTDIVNTGGSVLVRGLALIPENLAGSELQLVAIADAGQFCDPGGACAIEESNEANNRSAPLRLTPRLARACPPLETPKLIAEQAIVNDNFGGIISWQGAGGCAPYSGTISMGELGNFEIDTIQGSIEVEARGTLSCGQNSYPVTLSLSSSDDQTVRAVTQLLIIYVC